MIAMTNKEKLEGLKKVKAMLENVMQIALIDPTATPEDMMRYINQLESVEKKIRELEKKLEN